MTRKTRSIPLARAALAAAMVLLPAACGHAPEESAPLVDPPAPAVAATGPRAAARSPGAGAAAVPDEAQGCGAERGACECDQGAGDEAIWSDAIESIALDGAPTRGPDTAPVTLVVFSDFQCPFCANLAATLRQVEEEYPGKVRFVYKHRPLPIHTGARLAAKASIAAAAQGRFWDYHDALFAERHTLDEPSLERLAADLGLDLQRFRRAFHAADTEDRIAAADQEASRLGVAGTPTVFLNGHRIIGARPIADFRAAVDHFLAAR